MAGQPKVSVVLTAHNYGKYLDRAIQSVLIQTFHDFELIVVDDGSTDYTKDVLQPYAAHPQVRIVSKNGVGLAAAANAGVRTGSGEYVVRLDADDYFDENILLVQSHFLDSNPHIHMVFADYYRVDLHGTILEHVRLPKIHDEVTLLDRSPLAAGAMYRRACFDALGGYDESLKYQEDYDFWIRFIDRFNVYNLNLPLMYYRQHERSMSRNFAARMDARRQVKRRFVEGKELEAGRNLVVIPAMARTIDGQKLPLMRIGSQSLLAQTIHRAHSAEGVERVIVSTEDPEIAEEAVSCGADVPFLRPQHLARPSVHIEDAVRHLLEALEREESYLPDTVAIVHFVCPFLTAAHITEALDTLKLYKADSVISVCQDLTFHWRRGREGLEMVGYQKRLLREEKETIFKENGALYVTQARLIRSGGFLGSRISYIEMAPEESVRLQTEFDFWITEQMLKDPRFAHTS